MNILCKLSFTLVTLCLALAAGAAEPPQPERTPTDLDKLAPFTRIELRWPAHGRRIPPAEAVEVRIYSGHHWWWGLQADWILAAPQASADGRTWTYAAELAARNPAEGRESLIWNEKIKDTLHTDLVSVFVDPKTAPGGKAWAVPTLHVFGPLTSTTSSVRFPLKLWRSPDVREPVRGCS